MARCKCCTGNCKKCRRYRHPENRCCAHRERESRAKHAARLVELWKDVPTGTDVDVRKDDGEVVRTKTRSGCYSLERVSRIPV